MVIRRTKEKKGKGTVAHKGHYLYKLYFPPTNFIFLLQTLFCSYKLYSNRTNFIIIVQTLLCSYKLYCHRTNFIFSYKLYCHSRKELIRKESGNEHKYFKMAEGEGDERDVIEHYFHLGYTNEIILEFLKHFHHIKISLRTLKKRKGNIIDEARIRAVIIRELSGPRRLQGYH